MDTTTKRRLTVQEHEEFRRNLYSTPAVDPIDELVAEIPGPVQTRKTSEISRLLSILDEISGKDGDA